jgi:hypothetical protein
MTPWQQMWTAVLLLAIIMPVTAPCAGQAYRWIDSRGVTHFSDAPPDGGVDSRAVVLERARPLPPGVAPDFYSIPNQARRLQQSRLEMDRSKAEKLEALGALRDNSGGDFRYDAYRGGSDTYYGYSGGGYKSGRRRARALPNPGGYNAINGYSPRRSYKRSSRRGGSRSRRFGGRF